MGLLQVAWLESCHYAASGHTVTSVGVDERSPRSQQIESISQLLCVILGSETKPVISVSTDLPKLLGFTVLQFKMGSVQGPQNAIWCHEASTNQFRKSPVESLLPKTIIAQQIWDLFEDTSSFRRLNSS